MIMTYFNNLKLQIKINNLLQVKLLLSLKKKIYLMILFSQLNSQISKKT